MTQLFVVGSSREPLRLLYCLTLMSARRIVLNVRPSIRCSIPPPHNKKLRHLCYRLQTVQRNRRVHHRSTCWLLIYHRWTLGVKGVLMQNRSQCSVPGQGQTSSLKSIREMSAQEAHRWLESLQTRLTAKMLRECAPDEQDQLLA